MKNLKINLNIDLDLIAAMLICFGLGILITAFVERATGALTHAEFGEYTGGGVATLFTLAGIFLFIQALKVQRKELTAAIDSRNEANVQSERQSKIQLLNGRIQALDIKFQIEKSRLERDRSQLHAQIEDEISNLQIELNQVVTEMDENDIDVSK